MDEQMRGRIRVTLTEVAYAWAEDEDAEQVVYDRLVKPLMQQQWTPMKEGFKVPGCEIYILEDNVIEVAGLDIMLPDEYAMCQLEGEQ